MKVMISALLCLKWKKQSTTPKRYALKNYYFKFSLENNYRICSADSVQQLTVQSESFVRWLRHNLNDSYSTVKLVSWSLIRGGSQVYSLTFTDFTRSQGTCLFCCLPSFLLQQSTSLCWKVQHMKCWQQVLSGVLCILQFSL